MNEETAVRKKIKTCNEDPLVVKLEKRNNLRIFCSKTAFDGVKQNQSIRDGGKESRRSQVIHTVNIYRTKSSLLINGPQMQKFILEVIQ